MKGIQGEREEEEMWEKEEEMEGREGSGYGDEGRRGRKEDGKKGRSEGISEVKGNRREGRWEKETPRRENIHRNLRSDVARFVDDRMGLSSFLNRFPLQRLTVCSKCLLRLEIRLSMRQGAALRNEYRVLSNHFSIFT